MRKTTLYIAMSLDGCIADENGSVDWLDGDGSEPDAAGSYADFIQDIDTVIMGRRTYDQVTGTLSPNNWPYDGRQTYVITHQLLPDQPGITFTSEAPATLVRRLQAEKGRGIWILGGAHIAQALLAEGFIDRLQITIIPTLLGGGVRLFDHLPAEEPLRLLHTRQDNGMVELTYEKREPLTILDLRDHPEWAERAARWFHEKWQVPEDVYESSIAACLRDTDAWPQWYLICKGETIVAGCGVAEDFHDRPDLMPNLVALYVEPAWRCRGLAGRLLDHASADMHTRGIRTLTLITEHDHFYERYGWRFLTMVHDEDGAPIRMYIHEMHEH